MESNDSSKPSSVERGSEPAARVVGAQAPIVGLEEARAQVKHWKEVVARLEKDGA